MDEIQLEISIPNLDRFFDITTTTETTVKQLHQALLKKIGHEDTIDFKKEKDYYRLYIIGEEDYNLEYNGRIIFPYEEKMTLKEIGIETGSVLSLRRDFILRSHITFSLTCLEGEIKLVTPQEIEVQKFFHAMLSIIEKEFDSKQLKNDFKLIDTKTNSELFPFLKNACLNQIYTDMSNSDFKRKIQLELL